MRYSILILVIFACHFLACRHTPATVTKITDYEKYLCFDKADSMSSLQHINTDIEFWSKKIEKDTGDAVAKISLAALHSARFKTTGNINDIHTSDSLYWVANAVFKTNTSSVYRALATNCITQHKFQQAKLFLDTALILGDDKYLTHLMRCDVFMELGDIDLAAQSLKYIRDRNSFDYLIREAKLLDHNGDLDGAISKMEIAVQKVVESNKNTLILWAMSNLADMYGHANRFNESYQCYLEVLKMKPDYLYALKGIAWLAFSHDKNTEAAKKIINYLQKLHPIPDYDLMLAEIAAYEENELARQSSQNKFLAEISDPRYGDMYNKYVFDLLVEDSKNIDRAMQIAEREVNNRPTSQSYDLLAWAYFNKGEKGKALKIAKAYVENRSHEPVTLYHLGAIYKAAGNKQKAKHYLQAAEDSAFELGPLLANKISKTLQGI